MLFFFSVTFRRCYSSAISRNRLLLSSMASHIKKCGYGVLVIIVLALSISVAEGQSTVGCHQNEEQQIANGVGSDFEGYFKEAIALIKSVRSDVQSLKGEIEILKNRIEDHDKSANSSSQKLKIQHDLVISNQLEMQRQQSGRSQCPTGFNYTAIGFPKCYALVSQAVDWNTAQQKCRQLHKDAHLAVINNALEQQIISQILLFQSCLGMFYDDKGKSWRSEHYWVGGQLRNTSDCSSAFEWKPTNRTSLPIRYSNWYPEEPNCFMNIENCLALQKNGQWNDVACIWTFCSICEVITHV